MINAMIVDVHTNEKVCYVDFGVPNHMTSPRELFREMKKLDTPSYVETKDDTTHLITHIEKVPLSMQDGHTKYLGDVLHIPKITKN